MTRCPTAYLELDGYDPLPSRSGTGLLVAERLYVSDERRLTAVLLDGARRDWEVPRTKPPPACYQVPRRIHSTGLQLWADRHVVCQLLDGADGVTVIAHRPSDGRELWRLEVPTPPALPWTEPRPAWDGARTEELDAFLVASEVLGVAIARTTRRTMRWPDIPAPRFHAQLEVMRIEPASGSVAWRSSFPGLSIPVPERSRFLGAYLADGQLGSIDWATGSVRYLAGLPGEPGWPRPRGRQVLVPSRGRAALAVDLFDGASGHHLRRGEWRRPGVRETNLFVCDQHPILQLNQQFISLLSDEDLTPRWEARATPYVYAVAAVRSGPIFVATSGNGGGLYALDRLHGTVIAEARLPGGAWGATRVDGTRMIASICGEGLAIAQDTQIHVAPLRGARAIAGSRDGHVVVLCGPPRPGVHVVDVRRVFGG
ncbi:MAG TPA: PQQ-binding-like beta-propeller repeat protein [Anaeromyxobacter sp.]|nr:PQQ-binding-like beta-propeller repeat protein [Anaeromyxobacter sp.]